MTNQSFGSLVAAHANDWRIQADKINVIKDYLKKVDLFYIFTPWQTFQGRP